MYKKQPKTLILLYKSKHFEAIISALKEQDHELIRLFGDRFL
jgi:hypothetical protein